MDKILTISVAGYNMEQFIRQNLESMALPEIIEDIEVFVVDDGGTDKTLEIAREFENKYPNSFHAIHKKNGGYGSTVNYSIAHATGKYFKVLDGDDWFDKEGLLKLVIDLKQIDADVIVNPFYKGTSQNDLSPSNFHEINNGKIDKISTTEFKQTYGIWGLTFKTEIIRKSRLDLPEHTLYTDQIFSTVPFAEAKTIKSLNYAVYCYRIGRDGQSVEKSSKIKHIDEIMNICEEVIRFYSVKKSENNSSIRYLKFRASKYYLYALRSILLCKTNSSNRKLFINYEKKIKSIDEDIFFEAVKGAKSGVVINLMRKSNYWLYYLKDLIPLLTRAR